jgi:IMP cyclohydrolase
MFFLLCLLYVDPSDPNQLALNPTVRYSVVIYSKHSRKNIILDPFPTVVDPSDPNEFALNPKVSYCVVIYSKHSSTITYFRV